MAGIASIPPIHLTSRAVEWLTTATMVYGNGPFYKAPLGAPACARLTVDMNGTIIPATPLHSGWCCGVEDMRAVYLKQPHAVRYISKGYATFKKDTDKHWGHSPIKMPTCVDCMVLMDQALEKCPVKEGKYIHVIEDKAWNTKGVTYRYVWVEQGQQYAFQKPSTKTKVRRASQARQATASDLRRMEQRLGLRPTRADDDEGHDPFQDWDPFHFQD